MGFLFNHEFNFSSNLFSIFSSSVDVIEDIIVHNETSVLTDSRIRYYNIINIIDIMCYVIFILRCAYAHSDTVVHLAGWNFNDCCKLINCVLL